MKTTEDRMAEELLIPGIGIGFVLLFAAFLPAVVVAATVSSVANRIHRRSCYEQERKRRIELKDGRRMALEAYAVPEDLIKGEDGKFQVYDKEEYRRRIELMHDRRRVRRHSTLNRMPTRDELLAQWAVVKRSHEDMIRFGSMLCDLEAYVDNSLIRDDGGAIKGRNPGVKGWLTEHCVEISAHYALAMHYKQMAVKLRQVAGMAEPHSLVEALPNCSESHIGKAEEGAGANENICTQNLISVGNVGNKDCIDECCRRVSVVLANARRLDDERIARAGRRRPRGGAMVRRDAVARWRPTTLSRDDETKMVGSRRFPVSQMALASAIEIELAPRFAMVAFVDGSDKSNFA